jgi:hypothetical protein
MKTVADIIGALQGLTLAELKAIQTALDLEFIKHSPIDDELYFLVFDILGEKPMSIGKFTNSQLGSQWRKSQNQFNNLMKKIIGNSNPRKVTIKALKKFLLEILFEDIKSQGIPLNMKAICQQLGSIDESFDRSFPNYLSCGLGKVILESLEEANGKRS